MDRTVAAVLAGKATGAVSRRLGRGGGTALPGLVAERLEPDIVARLARTLGRGSAVVTGTNGKTTTSRLLAGMFQAGGVPVLHNRSGSNLMRGLAAALTTAAGLTGAIPRAHHTAGVFEVDEATLPAASTAIRPRTVAFTNLFRDQLDRYGEVDSIAALWRQAVAALPRTATMVLNADDPSVTALRRSTGTRLLTFGVEDVDAAGAVEQHPADARWCSFCGTEFAYTTRFFWHVGHWSCPGCGDARPTPDVAAVDIFPGDDATVIEMRTPAGPLAVSLPMTGLYNVYNALAATASALAMGLPLEAVAAGIERFSAAFGRQEVLRVRGRTVQLFLCKNPAGVNQVLRTVLGGQPYPRPAPERQAGAHTGHGDGDTIDPSSTSSAVRQRRAEDGAIGDAESNQSVGMSGSGADSAGDAAAARVPRPSTSPANGSRSSREQGRPDATAGVRAAPLHLLFILNDDIADGRDVSWIWDVDYELLAGRVALVAASGMRAADMALRLKYAGLEAHLVLEEDVRAAISRALAATPVGGRLYVLPTYTAMLTARDHLAALAGQGRFWKQ